METAIADARRHRPRTLQWVGGEPTIHLPAILEAMAEVRDLPPIVWKSNFNGTPDSFQLLDGIVNTFVADFKFGNDACARRLATIERYVETVTRNLLLASRIGNLIVRHLLMPGHLKCCFEPVARWMARKLPDVKFSLRDGFLPRWLSRNDPDLARPLDAAATAQARELAERMGLNLVD